jgi:hypothetical protein
MSDTKKIQITGAAAEVKGAVNKKRVSRNNNTNRKNGATPADIPAIITPTPTPPPPAPPVKVIEPTPDAKSLPSTIAGGAKTKVVLEPPKKTAAKLVASKSKTRKAKKIRVSLTGLGKRITRHKKIQKEARSHSIEEIKKILVAAKLIKPESKAPESILRQIYADYQTLKNKAL